MANLQSRLISKEVIKPSSPTPSHLQTYNLSIGDQFAPPVYIPFIFFYQYSGSSDTITSHQENASKQLKKSLSQTLSHFYPFSGKLVNAPNGPYVDCNDEGVDFLEAQVSIRLSEVSLRPHYHSQDHHFFPTGTIWGNTCNNDKLVRVQLNYFDCGGLALAVCLSHKIGDTCTLYNFINHWATVSHNHYQQLQQQDVVQPLPPHIISSEKIFLGEVMQPKGVKFISKRFNFPNSKIVQLKAQVGITSKPATRVEVVTSLLYGCAVSAANANRPSLDKIVGLTQTVNMRKMLTSPLQETAMGNWSWFLNVNPIGKEQLALEKLTVQIQMAKTKLAITISELDQLRKLTYQYIILMDTTLEYFVCTSLCGYQVYGVDFGWGKSTRVSFPGLHQYFILMDNPNEDGIEAIVSLREEDMEKLEVDEQLLAFAFPA